MVSKKVAKRRVKHPNVVGVRLKKYRLDRDWSQQKLSTLSGVDTSFISRIERGESVGTHDTLTKLAGALAISLSKLLESNSNVEYAPVDFRRVPVIDLVQAGNWRAIQENLGDGDIREYVMTNMELPASSVALRVTGDSMEPEFTEGDLVIVVPSVHPRIGDFVVAADESGEATLKQYAEPGVDEKGRTVFELVPLNPLHPRWRSDRKQIAILGVVVEHRKYRRR